ncbi:MAG: hypothetical protein NVSMB65_06000 [Chloroflexota bacterium]
MLRARPSTASGLSMPVINNSLRGPMRSIDNAGGRLLLSVPDLAESDRLQEGWV